MVLVCVYIYISIELSNMVIWVANISLCIDFMKTSSFDAFSSLDASVCRWLIDSNLPVPKKSNSFFVSFNLLLVYSVVG